MIMDTDTLIHFYISLGLTYNDIVSRLALQHQVLLSEPNTKEKACCYELVQEKE